MLNFVKKCLIFVSKLKYSANFFFAKQICWKFSEKKLHISHFFSANGMQKLWNFCFGRNFAGTLCIDIHMNLHSLQIHITFSMTSQDTFSALPICCSICVSSRICEPTSFHSLFWLSTKCFLGEATKSFIIPQK